MGGLRVLGRSRSGVKGFRSTRLAGWQRGREVAKFSWTWYIFILLPRRRLFLLYFLPSHFFSSSLQPFLSYTRCIRTSGSDVYGVGSRVGVSLAAREHFRLFSRSLGINIYRLELRALFPGSNPPAKLTLVSSFLPFFLSAISSFLGGGFFKVGAMTLLSPVWSIETMYCTLGSRGIVRVVCWTGLFEF